MYRIERDALGEVRVPEDAPWGAQTQRSIENFAIGTEKMPRALLESLLDIKEACATANAKLGAITSAQCESIHYGVEKAREAVDVAFPLVIWQTGSGTQSNMNANEVIARFANLHDPDHPIHPNDHVNRSQSSNDVMPTALHLSILKEISRTLLPALEVLKSSLQELADRYPKLAKCGRTHLQDATPLYFSDEVRGWVGMLEASEAQISQTLSHLRVLAIGGTAVGTGLNAPKGFADTVATLLSERYGEELTASDNAFHQLASRDGVSFVHGALRTLAANLYKIANDIRWLGSGPRAGLGEILLPENEPGSSIMPGKVNPTQAEALHMVCMQVMGNDTTVMFAASSGNFELNVTIPLLAYATLQSIRLLSDGMISFAKNCVDGITVDEARMKELGERSLMNVTALTPHIGYSAAAQVAQKAHAEDLTLKESALRLGHLDEETLDRVLDPARLCTTEREWEDA